MTQQPIVVATGNPGKLREIRQVLADLPVDVLSLSDFHRIPEPQETGTTFAANARHKARYYAEQTGLWCLADDSGLAVGALGGRPGLLSARYAADRCGPGTDRRLIDAENNRKLLDELAGLDDEERGARFICHLALSSPTELLMEAEGVLDGRIAHQPRGDNGFGYDPLFIPARSIRTAAELTPDEKNAISHRGKAVRLMAERLKQLLARYGQDKAAGT